FRDIGLSSTGLEWLVVMTDGKVAVKGTGTVNGAAGFGFVAYGYVGCGARPQPGCQPGPDRFRIVIWPLAQAPTPDGATAVFDNVRGASFDVDQAAPVPVQGGSIQVHS